MERRLRKVDARLAMGLVAVLACASCGGENPMGPNQPGGLGAPPPAPAPAVPQARPGAAAGPGAGTPVLYDSRDREQKPADVVREPTIPPEREAMVLSVLAPAYKTRREDCQGDDVLFHFLAAAAASFTAPGAKQAAYLVASGPCSASFPDGIEGTHLVIMEGTKVVAQASGKTSASPGDPQPFYGTEIRGLPDVDRDGVNEVLVTSKGDGEAGEVVRLYSFAGGVAKRLRQFNGVYRDGCAGGQGKVQAQVLHYAPGAKDPASQFTAELFEASCSPSGPPKVTDFQPLRSGAGAPASGAPPASPGQPSTAAPSSPATAAPGPSPAESGSPSPSPAAAPAPTP